jgi:hypothetical protein
LGTKATDKEKHTTLLEEEENAGNQAQRLDILGASRHDLLSNGVGEARARVSHFKSW